MYCPSITHMGCIIIKSTILYSNTFLINYENSLSLILVKSTVLNKGILTIYHKKCCSIPCIIISKIRIYNINIKNLIQFYSSSSILISYCGIYHSNIIKF